MRLLPILIFAFVINSLAQEKQVFSSQEGRYFMVGFMKNEVQLDGQPNLVQFIYIGSRFKSNVSIKWPNGRVDNYLLEADNVLDIPVPDALEHKVFESVTNDKVIEVISDNPIIVYAYSTRRQSSDMYTSFPVNSWGNEYFITTMGNDFYLPSGNNDFYNAQRTGEFLIMASEDDTQIEIQLTAKSRRYELGETIQVTLNKGDSYQVGGSDELQDFRGRHDLTGTKINSNKPIGVVAGHMRSSIPQTDHSASNSKDHLNEMLMPTDIWGKNFISIPFENESQDNGVSDNYFKVVAQKEATQVKVTLADGTVETIFLGYPGYHDEKIYNQTAIWESNEPIQIMQFMARTPDKACDGFYDPAMMLLTPSDKMVNFCFFRTPEYSMDPAFRPQDISVFRCGRFLETDNQISSHKISILMDNVAALNLRIDGRYPNDYELLDQEIFEIDGKNYYLSHIRVEPGPHIIESQEGKFTSLHYGYGLYDSYAHTVGASFFNEDELVDEVPPVITFDEDCGEFTIEISDNGNENLGVFSIEIEEETLNNITYNSDYDTESDITIISGSVIDKFSEANLFIEVRDYVNNSSTFNYTYNPIVPELSESEDLGSYLAGELIQSSATISNNNSRSFSMQDIRFSDNITLLNPLDASKALNQGENLVLDFEFESSLPSGEYIENVDLFYECDISLSLEYSYTITSANIDISGYDFNEVLLGETKEGNIEVRNTGVLPVEIKRFIFSESPNLQVDYEGSIGNILKPEDGALSLSATFSPDLRSNYIENIQVEGSSTVNNRTIPVDDADVLRGRGIAPRFESIEHDFGVVIVGQRKSETFRFENTGNTPGLLRFESFDASNKSYSINAENTLSNLNRIVLPDETYEFEIEFAPDQRGDYSIDAFFETDWDLHPEIAFRSIGRAVEISGEAINNCFDTLENIGRHSKQFIIFRNTGDLPIEINEIEIDRIRHFDAGIQTDIPVNDPRFILTVPTAIVGNELAVNDEISIDFEIINPDKGTYSIDLLIEYLRPDENGDIQTIRDIAEICADVYETQNYQFDLALSNGDGIPCVENDLELRLENNSNYPVEIVDIEINSDIDFNISDIESVLPIRINPLNTQLLLAKANFDRQTNPEFNIQMTLVGKGPRGDTTITFEEDLRIDYVAEALTGNEASFDFYIKDVGVVEYDFKFPYSSNQLEDVEIFIEADYRLMHLLDDNFLMKVEAEDGTLTNYNLEVGHSGNRVYIYPTPTEIDLRDGLNISFELPFQFLLATYYETDIRFTVNSDRCFLPYETTYSLNLDGNCEYIYRPVDVASDELNVSINSRLGILGLEFEVPAETDVHLNITDIRGIKIKDFEKNLVKKGNHLLYYDLNNIPSGNYLLSFETNLLKINRLITITK